MNFGLKVWDESGGEVIEISSRLPRLVGIFPFTIPANTYSHSLSLPPIAGSGQICGVCSGVGLSGRVWAEPGQGEMVMRRLVRFPGNDAAISGNVVVFQL